MCTTIKVCLTGRRQSNCCMRFMSACVLRTLAQELWSAKPSAKGSTGLRPWRTLTKLFAQAPTARNMLIIASPPRDQVHLIPPVWPLACWGIDIVGPLPTAPGNYKYATVAVEYFSKWIEAKVLRGITAAAMQKFFWQNIVCRFGVPKEVTVDNGKQFDCTTFREFCSQLGTKLCFTSVYHPQSNRAVERVNGVIFIGIKKNITEQLMRTHLRCPNICPNLSQYRNSN